MKTKVVLTIATAFLVMLAASVQAQKVKKEIKTDRFSSIEINSIINATLIHDTENKVIVSTDQENSDNVEVIVKEGELRFELHKNGYKSHDYFVNVEIYYEELNEIDASGASKLVTENVLKTESLVLDASGASQVELEIEVETLYSDLSGAANVKMSGKADEHKLQVSGAANLKAYELKTETTKAEVSGAAMAYVYAIDRLVGNVEGVAQLKYDNEPATVEVNKTQTLDHQLRDVQYNYRFHNDDSVKIKVGKMNIQVIDSDTTIIRMGRSEIKIDEDGNVQIGREHHKKSKKNFDGHWAGFSLGVNGYLNSDNKLDVPEGYDQLDLSYNKSINVNINFFEQNFNLINEQFGLTTGLGFMWDNYRFDDDVLLNPEGEALSFLDPVEGRNYKKSKLTVVYLTVPMMFEFQTNNDNDISSFHMSAGVLGGLRIGTHSKVVYNGSNKNKERDSFYLNPFRGDAIVRVGWGKINLYASYGLVELFKEDKGPELYPFNVGIQLLNF